MSSVEDAVREFLDRLERGEATVEERSLADRLAWWAAGWRARGAGAPVEAPLSEQARYNGVLAEAGRSRSPMGIRLPAEMTAAPMLVEDISRQLREAGLRVEQPLSDALVVHDTAENLGTAAVEEFPRVMKVSRPPREILVVARMVAPPLRASRVAPGMISADDQKFADDLLNWDGQWVEVDCSGLTEHQTEWLAKKINGQGAAYRPLGSFQAVESGPGVIYARAVDDLPSSASPFVEDLLSPPLGTRTTSPRLDRELVSKLLAEQGRWFEIDVVGLSYSRIKWLQDKLAGSGLAYRPAGSFETRRQDGGLWVRAVPGGAGSAAPRLAVPERSRASGAANKRSLARKEAPSRSVAVLVPPVPFDPRTAAGASLQAGREAALAADRAFAAEIRSFAGEWVEIEVSDYNSHFAFNLGQKISKHGSVFRPAGSFEATVRGSRLYARYLGDEK